MQASKVSQQHSAPFELSLRIRHPNMDPAVLSRELALEPEHSFRAGAPRVSRSGLAAAAVHPETYWLASLNPSSWLAEAPFDLKPALARAQETMAASVAQSIGWALSLAAMRLRGRHAALLNQIRADGGQVSLLVALCPSEVGGFSLTPDIGRVFGELGVGIEFEFTDA